MYLVIERGEFERGGKSSSKNIQVTALVLDEAGQPIQVCVVLRFFFVFLYFLKTHFPRNLSDCVLKMRFSVIGKTMGPIT